MRDESHDPGAEAAGERGVEAGSAAEPLTIGKAGVRFGTSSWTDPTLLAEGVFYPPEAHTPETRLRYYASRFSVVEVDSSYYALPSRRNAEIWVERTPAHFVFDIKAHALMTGQPSEVSRLPADLKKALPKAVAEKARVYAKDLEPELRKEIWQRFREAVEPLHAAGKLGAVMLQYPRWFTPNERARAELAEAAERLDGLPCAVEFRSALWFEGTAAASTLRLLEDNGLSFVMVDEPQGMKSSVPPDRGGDREAPGRDPDARPPRRRVGAAGDPRGRALPLPLQREQNSPSGGRASSPWRRRPSTSTCS